MITCREVIAFLLEYLEGTLDRDEARRFEEHLAECDSCVAYLHTYEMTIRMSKAIVVDADCPEDLVKAVLASRS